MQITAHCPEDLEQLRQYSRQQRNAKQRDRYRAVLLALEGHEAPEIAQTLDHSRRFVQRWVYRYRDQGLDALGPQRQPGRPSKLPAAQYEAFQTRFLADPTAADGVCRLRAKEAQRILAREFAVAYTLGGIYDLRHRLGLSCLVRRSPVCRNKRPCPSHNCHALVCPTCHEHSTAARRYQEKTSETAFNRRRVPDSHEP
jgi:transposase